MDLQTLRRLRMAAVITISAAVIALFYVWKRHDRVVRAELIASVEVPLGTSGSTVATILGEPDVDLPSKNLKPTGSCAEKSGARGWRYFTPDGGPYVFIYFDDANRVTCVEKGFVAL